MVNFDYIQNNYRKKSHEKHISKKPFTFNVGPSTFCWTSFQQKTVHIWDRSPSPPLGENKIIGKKKIIWPVVKFSLIATVSAGQC